MRLQIRPAAEADLEFCEALNRSNMTSYLAARGIAWDPQCYRASWVQFENYVISADRLTVGLLQLLEVDAALEIRDLQLVPTHRGLGLGTWAVGQAKTKAAGRGLEELRLRVYTDNPARHLYGRLGFAAQSIDDGVIHMSYRLPPNSSVKPKPLGDSA